MKKQFLTTTALVAASVLVLSGGAVADDKMMKPSLKIGGVFEQGIGFQKADSDDKGIDDGQVVQQEDGEIHFIASMKLDNGITVSGKAELESDAENSSSSQWIDESYMDVTGSFGKIRIGATDGAAYEMAYGYMGHVGTATGHLNLEFDSSLSGMGLSIGRGIPRLSNDDKAVMYFTPRISGLQGGVSYAQTAGGREDIVSTAVNYNGKFGDAGVGAAVGYAVGNGEGATADATMITAGLKADFGGFTAAAGIVRNSKDDNTADEDFTRTDVGLRYKFGPNAVRVGYIQLSDDAMVDQNGAIMTFSRSLGPGVSWSLDALMTKNKEMKKDGSFFGTSVQIKF